MNVKHKGITAIQTSNNHVIFISEDEHMLFHASCTQPKTEEDLIKMIDGYFERIEKSSVFFEDDYEDTDTED